MKNKILLLLIPSLLMGYMCFSQAKLNSYPAAAATIYLDFDGEEVNSPLWNNGHTINCAPAGLSSAKITEVFNRVAEDYRPFNINITTDIDVFIAAPADRRIQVIVTPTSNWFPGVGGVSYLGAFTWGDDTPCFVFCDRLGGSNTKMIAECCSHESGHALGLTHQSRYDGSCHLTATYNDGTGAGETAWAPIMGNSYNRNMSGWSNGPTPYGCGNTQDNLSIITSQNGFSYRADDHSDDINSSPALINATNINVTGVISTSSDKDAFTFSLAQNANFHLDAVPFGLSPNNDGANLDIKLNLYDAAKKLIREYDPAASMGASIDTILLAGTYYLVVDGTGNNNASDYGSLGSYTLKGIFGVLPVCDISLVGNANNSRHTLNWSVSCNEDIISTELQASEDGIYFSTVSSVDYRLQAFSYVPAQTASLYYRLRVVSLSGNITYSGIVLLKKLNETCQFKVATFVHSEISVVAGAEYRYQLSSLNGNSVAKGIGIPGFNRIPVTNLPAGIYILQLWGCGSPQTVRVLKM